MSVLTIKNTFYKYKGANKNTLTNINIDFENGKLYAIMGKSGAGKTTLLSLISGLDNVTEGEILFNDESLKKINKDEYRAKKIGIIFQGYNLLTNATALENILLSVNISKTKVENKKEYAYQLLESVGLDKAMANRPVLKLSGGEQQRVSIARAISNNTDIIIADEPTGNLDSDTEKNIMNILLSLAHEKNKCVIVVTHSKQVAGYADELWGLNQGNLVFVK